MEKDYIFVIDDFATELKQHLNLSEAAWLVIDGDIKNFYPSQKEESFSGFLNRVFKNYYQLAEASISLRSIEKKEELEKLYSTAEFKTLDKKTIAMFIDKYTHVYADDLRKKSLAYPSGHGEKFRINKENLDILRESNEGANYQGTIGLYLKAIFEEYARKPAYIREQIFFLDTIKEIERAIAKQRKLKLVLNDNPSLSGNAKQEKKVLPKKAKKYYVSPYKIVQDKTNQFNYLIGYSEKITDIESPDENGRMRKTSTVGQKSMSSFRISRINQVGVMASMGAKISEVHKKELDEELVKKTPMYMSGELIDVKVRFSDKGLDLLKRQAYMRPQFYDIDSQDKHVYVFHCTEFQITNYMFKFDWDAYVIEPESLRIKFKNRYERALQTYEGMSKEEIIAGWKAEKAPESEDTPKE